MNSSCESLELLTLAEVADELKISVRKVRDHIDAGELRSLEGIGRGRGLRVRREWLEEFARSKEIAPRRPELEERPLSHLRRTSKAAPAAAAFASAREARVRLGLVKGARS